MDKIADVIFFNGKVITVNKNDAVMSAVAVKGNKIIAVGSDDEIKMFAGGNTTAVDLAGRALVPGFIDSHIHYSLRGMKQGPVIDIDYDKAHSIKEIKELILQAVKVKKPGDWITLNGYDHNKLTEKRHPTREDLDEVAPNNPVRCTRCCAHMGVYNSLALKLGGIEDSSQFAPGEIVVENGKLTGLLKENAHMYMGQKVVFTDEQIMEGLLAADKLMMKNGITSVHDAGFDGSAAIRLIGKGTRSGALKTRIRIMIFDLAGKDPGKALISNYIATGLTTNFGNEHFSIGPCKLMLDGSSSGPSSATKEPYSHDRDLKGILVWTQEEVDEWIAKIHNAGYQVTAHAVGDKAVEIIVNAIEKAMTANPRENCRHRIEHCGIVNPELLKRIKKYGIVPIANPGFIELNGTDYIRFYGDRVNYMFPCKSYIDEGIIAAIGSDTPVILENPMFGLYGAITRADGKTGDVVCEGQKIGILDAIRMYTYNGAYASFEENIKGSIETGKLADLVVLSENILETPANKIKEIKVDLTMIDGEIVYSR